MRRLLCLCLSALLLPVAASEAGAFSHHIAPARSHPAMTPPPGNAIRVKGVSGDTVLTLVPTAGGGLVRVDVLTRLLGGNVDSLGGGRWRVNLYSASLEIVEGAPFASYNGYPLPLSEPTRLIQGRPHSSLQLYSEILPRFGIGVLWDKSRWEVRIFEAIARRSAAPGSREPGIPVVAASNTVSSGRPALSRRYTVMIDAGHGGKDPGNLGVVVNGRRLNEARLVLPISLKVEAELKARGLDVIMTRRTDTLIALNDRGPIANARKADLFISLHTNAANPAARNAASVRGFETYFLSEARSEDEKRVAAMENEVVRFETDVDAAKGDPLSFIINDLAQNEHLRESSDLALVMQQMLAREHPGPNRGVKQAPFAVLARSYMPAVLVELGFGSNVADARWMASEAGQRALAEAVADAAVEYLVHYERRMRTQP